MALTRGILLARTTTTPTVRYVMNMAAVGFDVTLADLTGGSRQQPLVHYRLATMAAVRLLTGESFPSIGRAFGRDHTTVMNALERVRAGQHQASGIQRRMWEWTQALCREVTEQWAIDTGITPAATSTMVEFA
jgi:chromosomal replication initiation ATPase DnaA